MKNKIIIAGLGITVLLGWIAIGQWGCEWTPERDNPLDPNSDLFNPVLTGEVTNLANEPVSQAMVTLQPEGAVAVTGNDGVYRFEGVDLGEYTLTVQKMDHVGDTVDVNIASGGTTTQDFQINALPQFDSISVTTHYISFITTNYIYVAMEAWMINPDGNTLEDSVLALFEEDTLGYLNNSPVQVNFFSYNFAIDTAFANIDPFNLELLVGRPFSLIAYDSRGGVAVSRPLQVIRFIEPPLTNSPNSGEPVGSKPTLNWDLYDVEYELLQNVRVHDDADDLVWDSLAIPREVVEITVTDSLQITGTPGPAFYYWTLEIVDIFGNTSRSRKLTFTVIEQ